MQHRVVVSSLRIREHSSVGLQAPGPLSRFDHSQPQYLQTQWNDASRDGAWRHPLVLRPFRGDGQPPGKWLESNRAPQCLFAPKPNIFQDDIASGKSPRT